MKKLILLCIGSLLLLSFITKSENDPVRIFVIGDSTAANYDSTGYPRMGWAQAFQHFFDTSCVQVINKASSGRSSKTFYNKIKDWPRVKPELQAGDYLFIQFGHNDRKLDTTIGTDPFTTYQAYLKRYIDEARALDVIPILLTSIHRNRWEADSVQVRDTHLSYLVAARQLAAQEQVTMIDMAFLTDSLYEALGIQYTTEHIFLNLPEGFYPNFPDGKVDDTHLQETGAWELAKLVADEIAGSMDTNLMPLAPCLQTMVKAPFRIEPEYWGYVKGPRYFPENIPQTLQAYPVFNYEFRAWQLGQMTLSQQPALSLSLSRGDTMERVARFDYATSLSQNFEKGDVEVKYIGKNRYIYIYSKNLITSLFLTDISGKKILASSEEKKDFEIDVAALSPGIYYLFIQRKTASGWVKILIH